MTLEQDTLALLARAAAHRRPPRVRALHLPPAPAPAPGSAAPGSSWCALELADASLGLAYLGSGGSPAALRRSAGGPAGADPLALAEGLRAPAAAADGATRALGFAAVHALSNWLWRAAGWAPPAAHDSMGGLVPRPGEKIGMIGLFGSLVPRLAAGGARLVVVELRPELHGLRDGALVTGERAELADCTQVLATATLVSNGSFEAMRAACRAARRFVLVGPSAGILPDALFARGVTALGGTWIEDPTAFLASLVQGTRRGASARKFALGAADYPGTPALIARL